MQKMQQLVDASLQKQKCSQQAWRVQFRRSFLF